MPEFINIRDTQFWERIESIFSEHPGAAYFPSRTLCGSRMYDYATFRNRVRQAIDKAERNHSHVFLLLAEIKRHDEGWSGVTGASARRLLLSRVASCLRSGDGICTLTGGGLAILIEGARDPGVLPVVTGKIHATITSPVNTEAGRVVFRPYFGAGVFPSGATDEHHLWSDAMTALQAAVASCGEALPAPPRQEATAAVDRFGLHQELHRAYRQTEFLLVYQPVFAARDGRIMAVEALLRWEHPLRGQLPPKAFLASLEDSGLIVPIGEWILQQSCRMVKSLADNGCGPVIVSVNVSARQMADAGFVLAALDAVYDAGIEPELLQLEFSERVIAGDLERAQFVFQQLRNAGVRIAVDAFSGWLCDSDLMRLPATAIKIDRSLVTELVDQEIRGMAIIAGLIVAAGAGGREVAAVGVEHVLQMELLARAGCDQMQGTLLSLPQTADDLINLLSV